MGVFPKFIVGDLVKYILNDDNEKLNLISVVLKAKKTKSGYQYSIFTPFSKDYDKLIVSIISGSKVFRNSPSNRHKFGAWLKIKDIIIYEAKNEKKQEACN